jgi:hypothetical protein
VALDKDDDVMTEQAHHPDLPQWQALIDGLAQMVVPTYTE